MSHSDNVKKLSDVQLRALTDASVPVNGVGMSRLSRSEWICNNNRYKANTVSSLGRAGYLDIRITGVATITESGHEYLALAASETK